MLSLEDELAQIDPLPVRLIAEERREVFSVFAELRVAAYLAVALITTGEGIIVKENADRIGPMTIVVALLLAAAACYWFALRKPARTIVGDYVLLLGALLVSAAVGYAESQFHLLGANWSRHFLLLALLHGATAYVFDSRLVLSAALTSLTAWFGVERMFDMSATLGLKALLCASVILVFRLVNRHKPFDEVFEHFAALLAFTAGLAWAWTHEWRWIGVGVTLAVAAIVIVRGVRVRSEVFVLYAIVFAAIAIDTAIIAAMFWTKTDVLIPLLLLVTTPCLAIALFIAHNRIKELKA